MPKLFIAGSGLDMFDKREVAEKVVKMASTKKREIPDAKLKFIYIGAASYDLHAEFQQQTKHFEDLGCEIVKIDLVQLPTSTATEQGEETPFFIRVADIKNKSRFLKFKLMRLHESILQTYKTEVENADIIFVSGGNFRFLMNRLKSSGFDKILVDKAKSEDGTVFCGGSAGLQVYFESAHSDAMNPKICLNPKLAEFYDDLQKQMVNDFLQTDFPSAVGATITEEQQNSWKYVRVEGLGLIPGMVVPHADLVSSSEYIQVVTPSGTETVKVNKIRQLEYQEMSKELFKKRGTERGVCVDHYCALIIDGDEYEVWPLPGDYPGSTIIKNNVLVYSKERKGKPGIWIREFDGEGAHHVHALPDVGSIDDLYRSGEKVGTPDELEKCDLQNPDPWEIPFPKVVADPI